MSNVIKSSFVAFSDQKKEIHVIESNDSKIINKKQELDTDIEDDSQFGQDYKELHGQTAEARAADAQASLILEHAQAEASWLIVQAQEEVQRMENEAQENGYQEGYQHGKLTAFNEVKELRSQLEIELQSVNEQKDYLYNEVESKLVGIIQKLVENMVGIQAFDEQTILLIIKKGLEEVDLRGDITIHVSSEDFHQVLQHRDFLMENLSDKMEIEILKDTSLRRNDCMIETELGSINCGLSEKMDGLTKQLQLIQRSFGLD